MEYTRLGNTGLPVSRLALGCMSYGDPATAAAHRWALDDDAAQPFFRQAAELGITFWDMAWPTTMRNGLMTRICAAITPASRNWERTERRSSPWAGIQCPLEVVDLISHQTSRPWNAGRSGVPKTIRPS